MTTKPSLAVYEYHRAINALSALIDSNTSDAALEVVLDLFSNRVRQITEQHNVTRAELSEAWVTWNAEVNA